MIRRRPTQVFSLAFLDCICCGFGAVILIFVLSVDSHQKEKIKALDELRNALAAQLASIAKLQDAKPDLEQKNARVTMMLVDSRRKNDSIHAMLDEFDAQLQREKAGQEAMLVDVDALRKEIAARQKKSDIKELPDIKPSPVGLPIVNNYIAFVIDCSGSMRDERTDRVMTIALRKIEEVLNSYPQVKGMQFFDADGRYILRGTRDWIPDTPQNRTDALRQIRTYQVNNISNPVPGLDMAIKNLLNRNDPDMKMGVFIFGDEFDAGYNALAAMRAIDRLDPPDPVTGATLVTINAVGFPTLMEYDPLNPFTDPTDGTQLKFANLMREICYRHGGAFIAISTL